MRTAGQAGSGPRARRARLAVWAGLAAALVYGAVRVVKLRWVCDDAFLSFRYAHHLAGGHGLVFNVGERVEGYTNFLWTVLVAGGMKLGIDPVVFSEALGAAAFFATIATALWLSWRVHDLADRRTRLFLPVAAIALLLQRDMHVWATSGLETSFLTALVFGGLAALAVARSWRAHLVGGLLFTLAALSRPDAILFYAAACAGLLAGRPRRARDLAAFLAPLFCVFAPYWLMRWSYYGYFFPNTYYAKSGGLTYYSQGLIYLALFVRANFVFLLVPIALGHLVWLRRGRLLGPNGDIGDRATMLAGLMVALYVFYAVRVGGDFMFARFFIPVTPPALLLLELWCYRVARVQWVRFALAALLVAGVVARRDLFATPETLIDGVASERGWYPESWRQDRQEFGRTLKHCLEGTDARLAFLGTYAAAIYYADLPYALETDAGLTDTALAHRPLVHRGRPGHEKPVGVEEMARRRINFLLLRPREKRSPIDQLTEITFGHRTAYIVTYDVGLMAHLKQFPDVQFIDFPTYLDEVIPHLPYLSDQDFEKLYPFYRKFYFDVNDDPRREAKFVARAALIGEGAP